MTLSPANPSVRLERESNNFRWIKFRSPSHLLQLVESLRLSAGVNFLGCNATRWRCWATHCLAPCLHWSHETVQTLMLMTHRVVQRVVMELWTSWAMKKVFFLWIKKVKSEHLWIVFNDIQRQFVIYTSSSSSGIRNNRNTIIISAVLPNVLTSWLLSSVSCRC